jgi:branched-chain amino acid transport system ATP-binding protein
MASISTSRAAKSSRCSAATAPKNHDAALDHGHRAAARGLDPVRRRGDGTASVQPHRPPRIAYCPEERGIFASLNVEENLLLPPVVRDGGLPIEQIYELFPNLKERRGSQGTKLSGGEQQMLAIGRILRTGAKLLLLDEPTEGLAPVIVQQIGRTIARLKTQGFTILLVEQNFVSRLRLRTGITSSSMVA